MKTKINVIRAWGDLQVICVLCAAAVMSSNGETSVVLRGVTHGAVDFLIKPVRVEELRNVWQHVIRRQGKDKKDQAVSTLSTRCSFGVHRLQ